MIYNFFMAQWTNPAKKNEWTVQVRMDLEEFGLDDDLNGNVSKWENVTVNGKYMKIFSSKVDKKLAESIENIAKFREGNTEN